MTAYAWLIINKKDPASIDLYYTMLRYRDRGSFPGGKFPPILKALGIPDDALKDKRVDNLSLWWRNEAFAFIIAHELGHLRYQHLTTEGLSMAEIRAGEMDADNFAFDMMGRSGTPLLGAALFFQAQIYSHTHRAEFPTRKKWEVFLRKEMTHPLSAERIKAMASYHEKLLARRRSGETVTWKAIGNMLRRMLPTMEDADIAKCLIKMAKKADLSTLHPRQPMNREAHMQICHGL
jgi:predicted Zn-dependent protease